MTELLSGRPIGDSLSYFGNLVSKFPLTYCGGLVDEYLALGQIEDEGNAPTTTRRPNPNTQPSHEALPTCPHCSTLWCTASPRRLTLCGPARFLDSHGPHTHISCYLGLRLPHFSLY